MATEKEIQLANDLYETICKAFDEGGLNYSQYQDDLAVVLGFNGENNLNIVMVLTVDKERQLIKLLSKLPFEISKDKRGEVAIATSQINYTLADGSFDCSMSQGTVVFRLTSSFRNSIIRTELIEYMIDVSFSTIENYSYKLLKLSNGEISTAELLEEIGTK